MTNARRLIGALVIATASFAALPFARAADAPVIDSIVDRDTGSVLWSFAQPDLHPSLEPGQAILLKGRNFGSGPLTAARPGLDPPAGGAGPGNGNQSVRATPPEGQGKELSKVLFGNVRALERNLSSFSARISIGTGLASILSRLEGRALDYFVEPYVQVPDTWAGDIYAWNDGEIDLTVPITAYEGPIQIIRIPVNGDYVRDIATAQTLLYADPNTARVVVGKRAAFVGLWKIARTDQTVLASNLVPVTIALDGAHRLQYGSIVGSDAEARAARQALSSAGSRRLDKTTPTHRSAADQYAYGEKAYWAWDWNLAVPHFVLGIDWSNIFGFGFDQRDSPFEALAKAIEYEQSGIAAPGIEPDGYSLAELASDGTVRDTRLHKAMIDRTTGQGIRPLTSFGAIPLLPDAGADKLIAPSVAFDKQSFAGPTPYPISLAFHLPPPFPKPLTSGQTTPTGWAGYVFAEAASLLPGYHKTTEWIGFNCAACHAARVTYEYEPSGKKVSRFFSGIPNPDWKPNFLALSGRAHDLVVSEGLPLNFISNDYPPGSRQYIISQSRLASRLVSRVEDLLAQRGVALSKQTVDKTLLLYNLPPGSTEATLFNATSDPGDYANDYFFSPEAIPIITNHTPVRRALSRSELIDGFEGAYLHGEEPEGARGPMSSRSLQDLTLYVSTLRQDDELLRRIGVYRWLSYKGRSDWLGAAINEGTFVSFGEDPDEPLQPASFPPKPGPAGGLAAMRDAAIAAPGGEAGPSDAFSQRFSDLAGHIAHGAKLFRDSCARCHAPGNAGTWTNEDMHPISAAGGSEPTGRFFSPTIWQRRTQSIRTAILENLFWVQQRGLLSDGHVVSDAPDNMDGLDTLVRPERCQAPTAADGSVDLSKASDLYKKLYTIHEGADHSFRIPSAGMRFAFYTRFGPARTGVLQEIVAPNADRRVREEEDRFVARHAYFTKMDDGYYYWDYQKMRREYGILEYGLDPNDLKNRARIGGLPAAPHPWCMPSGSSQADIDDLVVFLLIL